MITQSVYRSNSNLVSLKALKDVSIQELRQILDTQYHLFLSTDKENNLWILTQ